MQFRVLEADHLRAVRLHQQPRRIFAWLGVMLLTLLSGAMVLALRRISQGRVSWLEVAFLAWLACMAISFLLLQPLRVRRLYRQHIALQAPFDLTFDSEGISISSSMGAGVLPWPNLRKWKESRDLFLV